MKTKGKIIFVSSLVLFIVASFIVASMIFLQDKKSTYDARDDDAASSIEDKTGNMERIQTNSKENIERALSPHEIIDKETKAIIDDAEKQEISFETEINNFN